MSAEAKDITVEQQPQAAGGKTRGRLKAAQRAYAGQKKQPFDKEQVVQFLPLVHKIAQRVATYLRPPLTYDDLVSAGTVGLVKAACDYDPSFPAEFKTYAFIRIKGAIIDELRGWAFVPSTVNRQIRRTMDLSMEITKQTGRPPSEGEIAEKLGLTVDEVYDTLENARVQQFLSIDGSGEGTPALANILSSPEAKTPEENYEQAELISRLAQAIQQLDERQRRIILLYYHQNLTMKQIAEVFEITEPRVSQLHATALFNLSTIMRQWDDTGK